MEIVRITCHVVEPLICQGNTATVGEIIIENTELLQHVAADIHTLVAGYTTLLLEALIAMLLFQAEAAGISFQIAIEA